MFNLQILNSLDKEYREEQIHVFPNELAKMGFQDNYYDDEETRKETLRNYLEKKIFIFKDFLFLQKNCFQKRILP